ncbi:hypothetical protein AAFF_G00316940 [Aldrovandia affinis]|uniref:Secreted protein n=1 Tax=Aldrovandia affinis TaxID=143900 RepID=A0AAD7SN25_9TELE|nr:hypothetical protein AAFF_G00316940 [Aldrovandia affinis]
MYWFYFLLNLLVLSLHEIAVLLKKQVWCVISWVEYPDTAVPEVPLRTIMLWPPIFLSPTRHQLKHPAELSNGGFPE